MGFLFYLCNEQLKISDMNIIIISRQGILDTPILIKNDITAQAQFEEIAQELLGEDVSEVCLVSVGL